MNTLRILLAVVALVASTFNLSAQTGTSTAPNLLMTPVGSPTITSTNITAGGSSNITYQVQATFNASLTAQNGDITIGLPAANLPLVSPIPIYLSILKNGVADTSTNYSPAILFSQPSAGIVAGSGSTFVLQKNNTVTVPITVAFVVTNGGANTYAVKLLFYAWSDSGGKNGSPLTGTNWTTAAISAGSTGGGTTTPVTPVPDYIQALKSTADLGAYLAVTAREIDIYVSSDAQVGNSVNKHIQLTGPATTRAINDDVAKAALGIKVKNATSPIYYQVDVHSADYRISLTGFQSQPQVVGKGGGYSSNFKVPLRFQGDSLMLVPDILQAKLSTVDKNGTITNTMYLNTSSQGFYASADIVGSGFLEITVRDGSPNGKTTTYDLRSSTEVTAETVATTASVTKENVEYILDKTEINLIPTTVGGVGKNVLGEIELTKPMTVSIAGMTSEGKKAVSFRYRQINPTITAWATATASVNGIASITLAVGDWQVIPAWDPKDLTEPPYTPINYGKGSTDVATN